MKKFFRVFKNLSKIIDQLDLILRDYESVKDFISGKLRNDLNDQKRELFNLKTRIEFYRNSFVNDKDYRNQFINEFPANFPNKIK